MKTHKQNATDSAGNAGADTGTPPPSYLFCNIVKARSEAEEIAACKALAKWVNDDLDHAINRGDAAGDAGAAFWEAEHACSAVYGGDVWCVMDSKDKSTARQRFSNAIRTAAQPTDAAVAAAALVPYELARDLVGDAYNAGTHGIGYSQQSMELQEAITTLLPAHSQKVEALRALSEVASKDWAIKRCGVVTGGEVQHFTNGISQTQIAMFTSPGYFECDAAAPEVEQQANTELAVAAVAFVRELLNSEAAS